MPNDVILQHMLDRLYASLLSGPAMNCRPHSSRQRIDLTSLSAFQDADPSALIAQLLASGGQCRVDAKVQPPSKEDEAVRYDSEHESYDGEGEDVSQESQENQKAQQAWSRQRSILTKLRNLSDDARTYELDTGVSVLALGYPLLSIPPAMMGQGSRRILAPVAFIPVSMEVQAGRKAGVSLACRESGMDRLVPNEALLAWLERETGTLIEDDEAEEATSPWEQLERLLALVCKALGIEQSTACFTHAEEIQLVAAPRTTDTEQKQMLIASAVLGMFPMANQGLLRDTREMLATSDLHGPVTQFIGVNNKIEPTQHGLPDDDQLLVQGQRQFADENLVTLADPFQARAVTLAKSTLGLVVHGPPGTGKSQTITNIIGDHLARGERVLFVCDKRTALDVVARRLEHLGLGDLLAVVHDPQRDQRDLYMTIRGRLENLPEVPVPARAETQLSRINTELTKVHAQLSQVHDALMRGKDDDDPSLHEWMGRWLSIDVPSLDESATAAVGQLKLEEIEPHHTEITLLLERAESIEYASNPWSAALGVGLDVFLDRSIEQMRRALASCEEDGRAVDATRDERIPPFVPDLELDVQVQQRQRIAERLRWLDEFGDPAIMQRVAAMEPGTVQQHLARFDAAGEHRETFQQGPLDDELRLTAVDDMPSLVVINQSIVDLEDYLRIRRSWFALFHFRYKSRAEAVARHYGLRLDENAAKRLHQFLVGLKARLVLGDMVAKLTGESLEGLADDVLIQRTLEQYEQTLRYRAMANRSENAQHTESIQEELALRMLESLVEPVMRQALLAGLDASKPRAAALETLEASLGHADLFDSSWLARAGGFFRAGREAQPTLHRLVDRFDDAEAVARVRDAIGKLPQPLVPVIQQLVESGEEASNAILKLEKAILAAQITNRIHADEELRRIDGQRIEKLIDRYQQLEAAKHDAVRDAILSRWRTRQKQRLLVGTGSRLNSFGADLRRRLFVRGKRAMRLRQVIKMGQQIEDGDPLFDVSPVWMASPETVAQIFPREALFDVVIFDEASQCRLEEALPVLTRAKRVVVAGDPKQLPPTRFFEAAVVTSETDELETEQDLFEAQQSDVEDLLSAALNLEVEEAYLDVHYRSRNADLIEFSNEQFYHSRLQSIPGHPANTAKYPPLSVERVEGIYEERCNRIEAERVVQIVDDLLRRAEPPSIGIACFNLKQRDLISDVLEDRAIDDAEFAARLAKARNRRGDGSFEGLFVKNLENVQGDERDHIIISTTYGPTKEGKFYRRFGPLGRAGGGRRLNVLVTRARHEVHLVTSIPESVYQQVDPVPEGMTPNGAWLLFAYLRYAENLASLYEKLGSEQEADDESAGLPVAVIKQRHISPVSEFGIGLACTLAREKGMAGVAHWGNPGFCVDLAMHDAAKDDATSLGVLCDFTRYPGCPDPVEWEVFRTTILQWTGWQIHRVWTPMFFRDPQRVVNAIGQEIDALGVESESPQDAE